MAPVGCRRASARRMREEIVRITIVGSFLSRRKEIVVWFYSRWTQQIRRMEMNEAYDIVWEETTVVRAVVL